MGAFGRGTPGKQHHLKSSLNAAGQGAEVRHALQFVVRHFDVKMVLQTRQQIKRLQAVDPESLEEVVIGRELLARHFIVGRRESKDLVESLVRGLHTNTYFTGIMACPQRVSGQIGHGIGAFDELTKARFDGRLGEQRAEDVDLALQFVIGDRLDELFGSGGGSAIELCELGSRRTGSTQDFAFADNLRD